MIIFVGEWNKTANKFVDKGSSGLDLRAAPRKRRNRRKEEKDERGLYQDAPIKMLKRKVARVTLVTVDGRGYHHLMMGEHFCTQPAPTLLSVAKL